MTNRYLFLQSELNLLSTGGRKNSSGTAEAKGIYLPTYGTGLGEPPEYEYGGGDGGFPVETQEFHGFTQSLWAYAHTQLMLSDAGFRFIADRESFRANVYVDATGNRTIGFGHKLEGAEQFSTITLQQGIDLLRQDVAVREAIIHRLIRVPLQLHQFDALVSLVFNIGEGRLGDSTLRRLLNAGDTAGAAEQFLVWNKGRVNGQLVEIPGLTRRRRAEKAIFLGQGYPPIAHAEARSITRQAQAGTHSFYAGAYAEEEGEVEGFSLSDYYAAFTDSPQQIANRIMQLIANHPGKFRFMNHIDNQLRELAQGGVIHYQYNRGTRQSPVYDQVQGTPDASLLQTIYNIMDASKAQGCTLMSLMRGAPGNPHAGKAVDISSIQGVTLNDATSPQVLNAVLVAILNLAPGRYKLGLPRTQPADASRSLFIGYEWNETFPIPGNANQSVRADLLTGMGVSQEQITARRQATIQRMNTLAGQQGIRDYNSWQYQILAVENQQARQQLTQALQTASSRGVTIAGLFADGRDHLHIGTNV